MFAPFPAFAQAVAAGARRVAAYHRPLRWGTTRPAVTAASMPPRRASRRVAAAAAVAATPPPPGGSPPPRKRRARAVPAADTAPAAAAADPAAAANAAANAGRPAAAATAPAAAPIVDGRPRCRWVASAKADEVAYHDAEWGRPPRATLPPPPLGVSVAAAVDRHHFEMITLEGAQAGLSWSTILAKRTGYRAAFAAFDPAAVAAMTPADEAALVAGPPAIVRHKGKVASTVANAAAFGSVAAEFGSFDAYLHAFFCGPDPPAGYPPPPGVVISAASGVQPPASTAGSARLAADLKRRGFRFFGPTTAYAYMQAVGVVNDHDRECHCWAAAEAAVEAWRAGGGGGAGDDG